MERTPGPWGLRGFQIRADAGRGRHVATYQISEADGRLLAAAPALLDMLREACDRLDDHATCVKHPVADRIRARVGELLGQWEGEVRS